MFSGNSSPTRSSPTRIPHSPTRFPFDTPTTPPPAPSSPPPKPFNLHSHISPSPSTSPTSSASSLLSRTPVKSEHRSKMQEGFRQSPTHIPNQTVKQIPVQLPAQQPTQPSSPYRQVTISPQTILGQSPPSSSKIRDRYHQRPPVMKPAGPATIVQKTMAKPASTLTCIRREIGHDTYEDKFKRKHIPDWAKKDKLKAFLARQYDDECARV